MPLVRIAARGGAILAASPLSFGVSLTEARFGEIGVRGEWPPEDVDGEVRVDAARDCLELLGSNSERSSDGILELRRAGPPGRGGLIVTSECV